MQEQFLELRQAIWFLHERFNTGCNQINRSNWDHSIGEFANLCQQEHDVEALKKWVLNQQNVHEMSAHNSQESN